MSEKKILNTLKQTYLLISKYKIISIIFLSAFILTTARVILHEGYIEGYGRYFIESALIFPALITILSRHSLLKTCVFASTLILSIIISAELFWNYQDKPWFSPPETNTCDGPCYGWFSFENDSPVFEVLLAGWISAPAGLVTRLVIYSPFWIIKAVRNSKASK